MLALLRAYAGWGFTDVDAAVLNGYHHHGDDVVATVFRKRRNS
jgi:hypothetical protein